MAQKKSSKIVVSKEARPDINYNRAVNAYQGYCKRHGYTYSYPSQDESTIEDNKVVVLRNCNGELYRYRPRRPLA